MPKYTTRSAIEVSIECPRKGLFNRFLLGTGIVPVGEYIPLVTGSAVHKGIEYLNVPTALEEFDSQLRGTFFTDLEEAQQDYTYQEQRALVEALVRVWALREYPNIKQGYETISIEKEYQVPLDKNGDLVLLARPDRLLQDKHTGELYTYSIKTTKAWYERMEDAYKVDLQGLTEAMAVTYVTKQKVLGTKFCFLVKGRREKLVEQVMNAGNIEESEQWITKSPLIYGYRTVDEAGKHMFAHSDKIVKPENKSGFGKLPKKEGWEKFKVWETKGGVKAWIQLLPYIQPELGDIFATQVITPLDTHRTMSQLKSTLVQIATQEKNQFDAFNRFENGENVDRCFCMNRRACYFPDPCEYLRICPNGNAKYDPMVANDPLGSGEFVRRVPHYETERLCLKS